MPKPFHELTLDEFIDLLGQFHFSRRIDAVHMHHTWRPNHADFASRPPIRTIEGMFEFHTKTNGWSDIAQHITIAPDGHIWTGRDWNLPPASATGFNGNSAAGPFMFEMIGDFDTGKDKFTGPQKDAVVGVVTALLRRCGLTTAAVKFHNQMSTKTCPGSAIDRTAFLSEVEAALAVPAVRAMGAGAESGGGVEIRAFDESAGETRQKSLTIIANWQTTATRSAESVSSPDQELAESGMDSNAVAAITGKAPLVPVRRGLFGGGADFTPEELNILRPHVINLRLGALSDSGKFQTSPGDVRRIFEELLPEEIERQKGRGEPLRLLLYAHGGLVSENAGIRPCLTRIPFWRANNVYPIFFCWETGLGETVADIVQGLFKGERGFVSDLADQAIEFAASSGGREVWGRMKRSAELSSLQGGGARMAAEMTRDLWNTNHASMEIHAVGHSAGSIFHSFLLPTLLDQPVAQGVPALSVKSLHFLAPACTTELFKTHLKDRIGKDKQILEHTTYTMLKDFELGDTAGPYQKSLLYLVSRAFEPVRPTPILGLEESLRDDSTLIRFYGLSRTQKGTADILFSKTEGATEAIHHGDFDDDVPTMNTVLRRMLGQPSGSIVSFPPRMEDNQVTRAFSAPAAPVSAAVTVIAPPAVAVITPGLQRGGGAKRALCIGIDAYPAPNTLAGCVNDAKNWASALTALGFETLMLLDGDATQERILAEMRRAVGASQPGDVVAIQYSGHGTQVQDADGDETDGLDEALVPVDFGDGRFIVDDDLRAVMQTIPSGVSVTCFMDCCHSGTNTRVFAPNPTIFAGDSRPRFMRITREINDLHLRFRREARDPQPPPRTAENMREVNFAACRPDQVAFESNGAGDFTRRTVPLLATSAGTVTNEAFQKLVIQAFGVGARQEPVLDCASGIRSAPLFIPPVAAVAVGAAAGAGRPADPILSRLDSIERRLTALER